MSKTYEPCNADIKALISRILKKSHQELFTTQVTVDAQFVAAEKNGMAVVALKHRGFPIAAQIQITSPADRARGVADAKLTIDSYAWERLNENSRAALIDHELEHLEHKIGKNDGGIDDQGRPKLKIRPHSWDMTGFLSIAERHGEAALEVQQIKHFQADFAQLALFPAGKPEPPMDVVILKSETR